MDAITTNQAIRDLDNIIDHVISDVEPTILSNNKGQKVVLMSLDEFSSWQETSYLLSNPANAAHLRRSIQEVDAGKIFEKRLIE